MGFGSHKILQLSLKPSRTAIEVGIFFQFFYEFLRPCRLLGVNLSHLKCSSRFKES